MVDRPLLIACDLSKLSVVERRREQELLARFRSLARETGANERAVRFEVAADAATLAAIGELFAFERLCCSFLEFRLTVTAAGRAEVEIAAASGVAADAPIVDFVRAEFGARP